MSAWAATAFDRPPRGFPGLRERLAEREIHVRSDERCTLCGAADPVGVGCCLSCLGRSGDRLVFLRRPLTRAARERQLEIVRTLLSPEVPEMEAGMVAAGHLALACVPRPALERVERGLQERGLSIRTASLRLSVASTPIPFLVLIAGIVASGALAATMAQPWLGVAAPVVAVLLWIMGQVQLHRPVLDDPERGGWLPADDEEWVVRTLVSLRAGRARSRFGEVVRLGRLLHARASLVGDRATAEDVAALLMVAADVARDLDDVAQSIEELEDEEPFGPRARERGRLRETADRFDDLLVRATNVLGGSHRRLVNDGSCSGELTFLIHEIDRGRATWAKAAREVEELLAESGSPD